VYRIKNLVCGAGTGRQLQPLEDTARTTTSRRHGGEQYQHLQPLEDTARTTTSRRHGGEQYQHLLHLEDTATI